MFINAPTSQHDLVAGINTYPTHIKDGYRINRGCAQIMGGRNRLATGADGRL